MRLVSFAAERDDILIELRAHGLTPGWFSGRIPWELPYVRRVFAGELPGCAALFVACRRALTALR